MISPDNILKRQRTLQLLQNVFEFLEDYLKETGERFFGKKPNVLTLNNITNVRKIGRTGLQLIKAEILSDAGSFIASIAIKRFSSEEEFLRAKTKTIALDEKLVQDVANVVRTPKILFALDKIIIYEGVNGETFDDSEVNLEKKLYLSGKALAAYHGSEPAQVNKERYQFLIKRTIKGIPIPEDKKQQYIQLGLKCLADNVERNWSGTFAFGDFHSENIMFESVPSTPQTTKEQIITWIIDPEFSEQYMEADRMEDIATMYIFSSLIDIYSNIFDSDEINESLSIFIKGYNSQLAKHGRQLQLYYEKTCQKAFLFHLGLNAFIRALHASRKDPKSNLDVIARMIKLGVRIWKKGLSN